MKPPKSKLPARIVCVVIAALMVLGLAATVLLSLVA